MNEKFVFVFEIQAAECGKVKKKSIFTFCREDIICSSLIFALGFKEINFYENTLQLILYDECIAVTLK